ncbi:MAG: class III extradiol ring-cleavage dioxygenase [Zoogloea oleivorans]|jgi:4,5-DOPA dioxygenase extradiol|uniref:DODA-type extradiol aromatic ring-opening family dioxygenase n=1 Tax=Zoogloea oleivorans TaxID=1552750 RepID=UPI002A3691C7|nr:class III extradiol ring-cleavage dioxygenase [Zoogloea oleivorans]MDY0036235.1 class III extradiol ring-cleavage dioxygenase [Zoogloea oleivorans]
MTARHPVLFVSHGAPDVLLNPGATVHLWEKLGAKLPRPTAILVISAHWAAREPTVSTARTPETIHDFGGFPDALYAMQYQAPGAPALAARVRELLTAAKLPNGEVSDRGLDHGAWIPLQAMYPDADIPVVELALQPFAGTDWHRRIGAALRPLRDEGVLILASGAVTHNFGWLTWGDNSAPLPQAVSFADWLGDALARDDRPALLEYRRLAAQGAAAHPSEEHLLPLFAALGAASPGEIPLRLEPEYTYGGLAMDAYLWQEDSQTPFKTEQ